MSETKYNIPALMKAVSLVELLCAEDHPLGVTEISRKLSINKNAVFRILRSLVNAGWVVEAEDGPKYAPSLRLFNYASMPIQRLNIENASVGVLDELWRTTGECTYLGIVDDLRVLYIQTRNPIKGNVMVSVRTGGRYLMHSSAPGKVLLAYDQGDLLDRLLEEGLEQSTPNTLTRKKDLLKEFEKIRADAYASDIEEAAVGLLCFAAPIFDYSGKVLGAIGVSGLTLRHTPEDMFREWKPPVIAAAKKISRHLGYCDGQEGAG